MARNCRSLPACSLQGPCLAVQTQSRWGLLQRLSTGTAGDNEACASLQDWVANAYAA